MKQYLEKLNRPLRDKVVAALDAVHPGDDRWFQARNAFWQALGLHGLTFFAALEVALDVIVDADDLEARQQAYSAFSPLFGLRFWMKRQIRAIENRWEDRPRRQASAA